MKISVVATILLGAFVSSTSGLRCWKCINARSPEECKRIGRSEQCRYTQTICQTEVRYNFLKDPVITTRCKESHACFNNERQNIRGTLVQNQCNKKKSNSVCRCCCSKNQCNRGNLLCEARKPRPSPLPFVPRRDAQIRRAPIIGREGFTPQCNRLPRRLLNGVTNCNKGRFVGSKCTFTCNQGYELMGPLATFCRIINGRIVWNRKAPSCKKINVKCERPNVPNNGFVRCTNSDYSVGTECEFICVGGLMLKGAEKMTCIKDRGAKPRWSESKPTCVHVTCAPLLPPIHGQSRCSGAGDIGTVCDFICDQGLKIHGPSNSSCIMTRNGAKWTNKAPTCGGHCERVHAPKNGRAHCAGSGDIGTNCDFLCDIGLQLRGPTQTSCIVTPTGPRWSNDVPECDGRCAPLEAPINGRIECSGDGEIGTACIFICNSGARILGPPDTECEMTPKGPQWRNYSPKCQYFCPAIGAPEHGRKRCFGLGEEGTICRFVCDVGYEMTAGSTTSTCNRANEGAKWSNELPTCTEKIVYCPKLGLLKNGNINCTGEDNMAGTQCFFQCSADYELQPNYRLSTECISRGGIGRWSKRKPCCNAQCPPLARKDIVIMIDSSRSISNEEWGIMKDFIIKVINRFDVSKEFVQIAAFRFNRDVDTSSQILFGQYDDNSELIDAIRNIPKNGGGTNIGRALRHATNVVLKHDNNRPDVGDMIWVVTDGKSKDKVSDVAEELRTSGVEIIALGIARDEDGSQLVTQLTGITGDTDLVMTVDDVVDSLVDNFVQKVANKICEVSCD